MTAAKVFVKAPGRKGSASRREVPGQARDGVASC
jgi:hypothetical protein